MLGYESYSWFIEYNIEADKCSKSSERSVKIRDVGVYRNIIVELEEEMLLVVSSDQSSVRIEDYVCVVLVSKIMKCPVLYILT